jgi:hypothetical protein
MPAARKPNPRDFTGVQKARLEAEHAEELEQRATEVALASAADKIRKATEVIDYTKGGSNTPAQIQPSPKPNIHPELIAELEEDAVEVGPKEVTIRVNSKIEDMVYGRNVDPPVFDEDGKIVKHAADHGLQFYSFEEGVQYKVPIHLAMHLDSIGYVYH